jgi:hypothetical protein
MSFSARVAPKQHPELIAAYMQTAAIDFGTAIIARAIETLSTSVEDVGHAIKGEGGQ